MQYNNKIDQAILLTAQRFQGIVDEDGQPYMLHCLRVMLNFTHPELQMVGLMHDLIEDTPTTLQELDSLGFDSAVVEAVGLLTRTADVSYCDYVRRLKSNDLARQVKLADLRDNSDIRRSLLRSSRQAKDMAQVAKYTLSYQYLEDRISEYEYVERMKQVDP